MRSMFHRVATSNEGVVATSTAILIAGVTAAAVVGTTAYQAKQERKALKGTLAARAAEIARAEGKVALADSQAAKAAQQKLKKFRLSQTRSILTSPLGVQDEAVTGRSTLLGG